MGADSIRQPPAAATCCRAQSRLSWADAFELAARKAARLVRDEVLGD
jgi:hypothetical protein